MIAVARFVHKSLFGFLGLGLLGVGFWMGLGFSGARERKPEALSREYASIFGGGKELKKEESAPTPRPGWSVARDTPVVRLARRVSPAVISVGAVRTSYVSEIDPFFRDFFSPFLVYPRKQRIPYLGSGFILDAEGHAVTNHHVIENSEKVFVTLTDGRELEAVVLDADRFADIAFLKIQGSDFPFVELGNSESLEIGETVVAFGNPFGNYIEDPRPTVTTGVVSALHRSFRPDSGAQRVYEDMIQTDAAINPGNSGGPLVTLDEKVVGINTFIVSTSGGNVGLGFAIPSNRIRAIVDEIRTHGKLRPLLLDFDALPLTPRLARQLDIPATAGAVIRGMVRGGPGEQAGLRVGDAIVKVDNRPVRNVEDLFLSIAARQVGDKIQFEIIREGKTMVITYQVTEAQKGASR